MDYHAWFILENSLGILDYGNNFNCALVEKKKDGGLFSAIKKLWNAVRNRQSSAGKDLDVQSITSRETCCRA